MVAVIIARGEQYLYLFIKRKRPVYTYAYSCPKKLLLPSTGGLR